MMGARESPFDSFSGPRSAFGQNEPVLACLLASLCASRIDPIVALRAE
jgi:hypothetical protein